MATVAFVACSKTKRPEAAGSSRLYASALFRKSLLFALSNANRTFILSAKHGMLGLGDWVEPYDATLKDLSKAQRQEWARSIEPRLRATVSRGDTALFLTGTEYHQYLVPIIKAIGARYRLPLGNLSLGRRLQYLSQQNREDTLEAAYGAFYRAMKRLYDGQQGGIRLSEATGRMSWPDRGVYFFFDSPTPDDAIFAKYKIPRITRVGTHAVSQGSRSTLWNRISTHRGTSAGEGSHRSSIFRLHVGRALSKVDKSYQLDTWGIGQVAPPTIRQNELHLERAVTEILGQMRFIWLDVPDAPSPQSDRSYLERNAIGVLSRHNVLADNVPVSWLGNQSSDARIVTSGLWNLNHLFEFPDEAFNKVLERYIEMTLRGAPTDGLSLAPKGWHNQLKIKKTDIQLSLFHADAK